MADASLYGGAINAGIGAISAAVVAGIDGKSARADAETANGIRAANNASVAAWAGADAQLTSLARWAQGVRNSRVYEKVGKTQEAMTTNFNRSRDARTQANFAASIKQAEESGRMQAAAASSGVTGSVVQVIDQTRLLRNHITDVLRVNNDAAIVSDEKQAEFDTKWALLDQLDNGLIFDKIAKYDFGHDTPRPTASPLAAALGSWFGNKDVASNNQQVGKFFNFGSSGAGDQFGGTAGIGDR